MAVMLYRSKRRPGFDHETIAKAAGLADWKLFSGRAGMAQNGAPAHETERQGRWEHGGGMVGVR